MFGPLAAGSHNYVIQVTDADGLTASLSGTFVVAAAAAPVIFGVVVAEATPQNGILESNEQGVVTWGVTDSSPITAKSLTVDGDPASATYGPFGPSASGAYFYSGLFGPLEAGGHNYVIQVTDSVGGTASYSGNFTVSTPLLTHALAAPQASPTLPATYPWAGTPPAADRTPVAAVPLGPYSAADGGTANLTTAGGPEFPEIVRLHAISAADGRAAAEPVELLGTAVRELRLVGGFSDYGP